MEISVSPGLRLNAPEFYQDPDFIAWLNSKGPKFTWHQGGQPTEWSDIVVLVDPSLNGEGSDSDMPEAVWSRIIEACRQRLGPGRSSDHYTVRITNIS